MLITNASPIAMHDEDETGSCAYRLLHVDDTEGVGPFIKID